MLRDDFVGNVTVDIREAKVASGVSIGELGMIQAHQVEDRRMEIVEVHPVVHRGNSVLIGGAIAETALESPASHPE